MSLLNSMVNNINYELNHVKYESVSSQTCKQSFF